MPGFVIHIASANEYIKRHKNDITNKEEFIKGCIAPDLTKKDLKKYTHYGENTAEVLLRNYLKENNLNTDYNKGYFLHLVTDYIFYNKIIKITSKEIYNDYDILNDTLIKKYKVILPTEVEDMVLFKTGKTTILNLELAIKTIELSSEISLLEIKEEISNNDYIEKWDKIRKLIRN